MKSMLIAAATIGAAIAALILYNERQKRPENQIEDAAKDAYRTMNEGIGQIERPIANALGS
jgi:hypothetical protein